MAFTLISGARAWASPFVKVLRAPFEAAYAIELPNPLMPEYDEMLTIQPWPEDLRAGAAARVI